MLLSPSHGHHTDIFPSPQAANLMHSMGYVPTYMYLAILLGWQPAPVPYY